MIPFPAEPRVLVYTVSRAHGKQAIDAYKSLHEGVKRAGAPHDWLLWCNSEDMLKGREWGWDGFHAETNGGENVGQHVPLRRILETHAGSYDFLVRVDDDLEWICTDWLARLLTVARKLHAFAGKHAVVSANVLGLINPIEKVGVRVVGMPVYAVGILGGACRLHHLSFFDGYEPDVRLAMGAADATTIAQHAEATHIPMFIAPSVRVRHDTRKHIQRDPAYAEEHDVFQYLPYIPAWRSSDAR